MSRATIRSSYGGYNDTESIVISNNDRFLDGLHKHNAIMLKHRKRDSMGWMAGRKQVKDADLGLVIDKKCILSFSLNDSRTSQKLRQFYLDQEDLMVDLAAIEREELREVDLSSPATSVGLDQYQVGLNQAMALFLSDLTPEQQEEREKAIMSNTMSPAEYVEMVEISIDTKYPELSRANLAKIKEEHLAKAANRNNKIEINERLRFINSY